MLNMRTEMTRNHTDHTNDMVRIVQITPKFINVWSVASSATPASPTATTTSIATTSSSKRHEESFQI
jgi:hypothetical protein